LNEARRKAILRGEKTYLGEPCSKGHNGLRYTSSKSCVECTQEWKTNNPEKHKENSSRWQQHNRRSR
jgi:hypothetical protein